MISSPTWSMLHGSSVVELQEEKERGYKTKSHDLYTHGLTSISYKD
jgi:hypothetical protein